MITYWLCVMIVSVIGAILSPLTVLPDVTLPASVNSGITGIAGFTGGIWSVFPLTLTALVSAVGVIVVVENWVFVYKLIRWVYQKIPGVN
jgi:hypothetical protein